MKRTKNPGKNKRKRQQPLMQVDRGTVDSQASMHLKVVAELNQFELDMQDTLAGVRDEILQEFREELEKRIDEMKTDMDDLQSQRLHSAMESLRHKFFGGEALRCMEMAEPLNKELTAYLQGKERERRLNSRNAAHSSSSAASAGASSSSAASVGAGASSSSSSITAAPSTTIRACVF